MLATICVASTALLPPSRTLPPRPLLRSRGRISSRGWPQLAALADDEAQAMFPLQTQSSLSQVLNPVQTGRSASSSDLIEATDGRKPLGANFKVRSFFAAQSLRRWRQVFNECDCNQDGCVDRRELLVLLARLEVKVPLDAELRELYERYDVDENGLLDFNEFTDLVSDLGYRPGLTLDSTRDSLRRWKSERDVLLWRRIFNDFDTLPRDGYLGLEELVRAFETADVAASREQVRRQLRKYDVDGDGQLDFNEVQLLTTSRPPRQPEKQIVSCPDVVRRSVSCCAVLTDGDRPHLELRPVRARAERADRTRGVVRWREGARSRGQQASRGCPAAARAERYGL